MPTTQIINAAINGRGWNTTQHHEDASTAEPSSQRQLAPMADCARRYPAIYIPWAPRRLAPDNRLPAGIDIFRLNAKSDTEEVWIVANDVATLEKIERKIKGVLLYRNPRPDQFLEFGPSFQLFQSIQGKNTDDLVSFLKRGISLEPAANDALDPRPNFPISNERCGTRSWLVRVNTETRLAQVTTTEDGYISG